MIEYKYARRSRGPLDQLAHFLVIDLADGRVVPEIPHGRGVLLQAEAHAFERRRLVELPRVRHLDGPRLHRINQIALVLSIDIAARGKLRVRLLVVEMGSVAWGFSAAPDGERPGSPLHAADGAEQECQRDRSSQPHGCVRNSESLGCPQTRCITSCPSAPARALCSLLALARAAAVVPLAQLISPRRATSSAAAARR